MKYEHIPVLFDEVIEGLNIKPDGIYLDGTLGGGGHSKGILQRLKNGRLIACDKDSDALKNAETVLKEYSEKITYVHDDFKNVFGYLDEYGIEKLDGVLLDLGVSSYQIDTAERGFSYIKDAPLDMRMDAEQKLSAYDVVNGYSEKELLRLLYEYGEERNAPQIVRNILRKRALSPIATTLELAETVKESYPPKFRYQNGNPAKKTFQAIRIEVNGELNGLKEAVNDLSLRLKEGGRICVITFHSLEDRIVKNVFVELEKDCICDKKLPVCVCNKRRDVKIITKKPISGEKEADVNKRAESAKLRIAERV